MTQQAKKNPALRTAIKGVGGVQPLLTELEEKFGICVSKMAVYHWLWQGYVPKLLVGAVSRITGASVKELNPNLEEGQ